MKTSNITLYKYSLYISLIPNYFSAFFLLLSILLFFLVILEFFCCENCSCLFNINREVLKEKDSDTDFDRRKRITEKRIRIGNLLNSQKFNNLSWFFIFFFALVILVFSVIWVVFSFDAIEGLYEGQCAFDSSFMKIENGFFDDENSQSIGHKGLSILIGDIKKNVDKFINTNDTILEDIKNKNFKEKVTKIEENLEKLWEKFRDFDVNRADGELGEIFTDSSINFTSHINYIKSYDLRIIKEKFTSLENGAINLKNLKIKETKEKIEEILQNIVSQLERSSKAMVKMRQWLPVDETVVVWIDILNYYITFSLVTVFLTVTCFFFTTLIDSGMNDKKEKDKMYKCYAVATLIIVIGSVNFNIFGIVNHGVADFGKNICFFIDEILSDIRWSDTSFGGEMKRIVDSCVFSKEKNINLLLDYDDRETFKQIGEVIEGFSWDIEDFVLNSQKDLTINLENYQNYLKNLIKNPDYDFSYSVEESPKTAVGEINNIIKCTNDELVFRKKDCNYEEKSEKEHPVDFRVKENYCISLKSFKYDNLTERYTEENGKCAMDSIKKYSDLFHSLNSHKIQLQKLESEFDYNIVREVKSLFKDYKLIKESIFQIKEELIEVVSYFENPLHSYSKISNCGFLSDTLYESTGGFCLRGVKSFSNSGVIMLIIGPLMFLFSITAFCLTLEKQLFKKRKEFNKKTLKAFEKISKKLESVRGEGRIQEVDYNPKVEVNEVQDIIAIHGVTRNEVQRILVLGDRDREGDNVSRSASAKNFELFSTDKSRQFLEMLKRFDS